MFMKSCIGVLIISAFCSAGGPDVIEGCNEVPTRDPKRLDRFNLTDFEHNNAKFLEVFRLKMVFKGEKPTIGISFNNSNVMFGPHKIFFGIFDTFDNFSNETKPCSTRGSKRAFSNDSYTTIEAILTKEGLFSVFVYGFHGFAISCSTGYEFNSIRDVQLLLGPKNVGTREQFFYDCPFM
ncbi:hypothetical protein ACFFRR_010087 [Megaselia abdita]